MQGGCNSSTVESSLLVKCYQQKDGSLLAEWPAQQAGSLITFNAEESGVPKDTRVIHKVNIKYLFILLIYLNFHHHKFMTYAEELGQFPDHTRIVLRSHGLTGVK
ncbi:hypothetical protein NPIL_551171 [Nephila pilipes]|uniref:Uncharacterized protein n=1 Tax=Nephila pilipes TaxID=299642 RepID=A0A8X6NKW9_NEPPI|nr:hypothetical protein NPIL_551171 [Nephila pilipes]